MDIKSRVNKTESAIMYYLSQDKRDHENDEQSIMFWCVKISVSYCQMPLF